MATWSGIRSRLENDCLAPSLRGRIQYYVTSYSKCPDHMGRASIRLDGKEIISGCYMNNRMKAEEFPHDETYVKRMAKEFAYMDDTALRLGIFDQKSFYNAFEEFDNQCIEESLKSANEIVRIFSILDRRIGKRRLERLKESITNEPEVFRIFFSIRCEAEGLV